MSLLFVSPPGVLPPSPSSHTPSPSPSSPSTVTSAAAWSGDELDGDILAAVAFCLFPLLCFYGRRHFHSSITLSSTLLVSYLCYLLLGYFAHLSPTMEYILIGVAAVATFTAVIAATDLGVSILGFATGGLIGNLILHFISFPPSMIPNELWFRLLFVLIPAIVIGLLAVTLVQFMIRVCSSFIGAYFLVCALSRLLYRLGLSLSAPFDPPIFFGPLSLLSNNPTPAFNTSLLLSYTLVTMWLVVSLVGVLVQYHQQYEYKEIERIRINGHEYTRVLTDAPSHKGALTGNPHSYHSGRDQMDL